MGNLFGIRRRTPVVTPQDKAILQLKQQRDKIKIYQKRAESELAKSKELALQLAEKNLKERALVVLRRKKFIEDIINRTDKQLETLEQLVLDIEYNQIQVSVVEGLKVGAEALKQLNSMFAVEDIQQIMDDTADASAKQEEISNLLHQSSERYDEDDLLKELKTYQTPAVKEPESQLVQDAGLDDKPSEKAPKEDAAEALPEAEANTSLNELPDVPKDIPTTKPEKQAEPERKLEAAQ